METPHLHRKYFSTKRHRDNSMKKWSHQIGRLCGRGVREQCLRYWEDMMRFRTALDTWDSEVLLWAERSVSERCPKAGGFEVLWIQIWEMTKVCHTMGALQAAVGPRTAITRGNKTESSIQRLKVSKMTSLNCSSFCKSKCGRRNKAQNNKIHQGITTGRAR